MNYPDPIFLQAAAWVAARVLIGLGLAAVALVAMLRPRHPSPDGVDPERLASALSVAVAVGGVWALSLADDPSPTPIGLPAAVRCLLGNFAWAMGAGVACWLVAQGRAAPSPSVQASPAAGVDEPRFAPRQPAVAAAACAPLAPAAWLGAMCPHAAAPASLALAVVGALGLAGLARSQRAVLHAGDSSALPEQPVLEAEQSARLLALACALGAGLGGASNNWTHALLRLGACLLLSGLGLHLLRGLPRALAQALGFAQDPRCGQWIAPCLVTAAGASLLALTR
jgi:hypothetical protein